MQTSSLLLIIAVLFAGGLAIPHRILLAPKVPDPPEGFNTTAELLKARRIREAILSTIPQTDRDCIFLHGAGENVVADPTPEYKDYWGDVVKFTPQCRTHLFNHDDTKNFGWSSPELQKRYCQIMTGNATDGVARNKIIFSHSMANVIVAAALRNKFCEIDPETSSWHSASSPWRGSKAANFVQRICATENSTLQWLADKLGYCDGDDPCAVYESLETNYTDWDELQAIAGERVSSSMCGLSAYGLTSAYSLAFEALDAVVGFGEANDGMVSRSSCFLANKDYQATYKSAFYSANINHADGTCRTGDGFWKTEATEPCMWYSLRT